MLQHLAVCRTEPWEQHFSNFNLLFMAWQARNSGTLPILLSPQLTFESAAELANVEGYISAGTPLKVERAQVRVLCSHVIISKYLRYLIFQSFDWSCLFNADVVWRQHWHECHQGCNFPGISACLALMIFWHLLLWKLGFSHIKLLLDLVVG
jgi:hypothetical protein